MKYFLELPLPEPREFARNSFNVAFEQVSLFATALLGISLTIWILKSFSK